MFCTRRNFELTAVAHVTSFVVYDYDILKYNYFFLSKHKLISGDLIFRFMAKFFVRIHVARRARPLTCPERHAVFHVKQNTEDGGAFSLSIAFYVIC